MRIRFYSRVTGRGVLHCHRCGGDRRYRRCVGRRWLHLLCLPICPLDRVAEHVQCRSCGTTYRLGVLLLPTTAQMQAALPDGSLAAAIGMLRAGDPGSSLARGRAVELVRAAGLDGYDDAALTADLAVAAAAGDQDDAAALPLSRLAIQLTAPAPEWFLADAVRVGLADGPLSEDEREAARRIAVYLGLTPAQAAGVISETEQRASAG